MTQSTVATARGFRSVPAMFKSFDLRQKEISAQLGTRLNPDDRQRLESIRRINDNDFGRLRGLR